MSRIFETLSAAAREELSDPKRSVVIGAADGGTPRFELYHFGFSICSQKVRTALAEKGVAYLAHELEPTENYRPHYVRLRLFAAGEQ
ncbi:MAG: glutathione S-transferase family protein, partial [Myxococcales bacterium]|nr:glutathione S-transferase family protein [Myxococcales bacterium]